MNFVSHVTERDIDFLILEELTVSVGFREWFSSRTFGEPVYGAEIETWHSVTDGALGESDLVFIFESNGGERTAILIEDKIDAPPQPKQAERYRSRGENGLKGGDWDNFKTALVAPNKYIGVPTNGAAYDVAISYEEILAYFCSRCHEDERFDYKAKILLEGIEQNRRGYHAESNEEITRFIFDYYTFAAQQNASLGMQQPKPRPAGSTVIVFYPSSFAKGIVLKHQITVGQVTAFFRDCADWMMLLEQKYRNYLPPGATIAQSGKSSVVISMAVPKIDPVSVPFAEQEQKVREALRKLSALETLVAEHGGI
ncbi:MAG TPA: PD-(D/E)XK nuclease superfamily protein [Gammaproteobacteria bacterium]|nr:PD-(D/E)XK nuclease superfamily protein [Gammaproteobacteria bacterium]